MGNGRAALGTLWPLSHSYPLQPLPYQCIIEMTQRHRIDLNIGHLRQRKTNGGGQHDHDRTPHAAALVFFAIQARNDANSAPADPSYSTYPNNRPPGGEVFQ